MNEFHGSDYQMDKVHNEDSRKELTHSANHEDVHQKIWNEVNLRKVIDQTTAKLEEDTTEELEYAEKYRTLNENLKHYIKQMGQFIEAQMMCMEDTPQLVSAVEYELAHIREKSEQETIKKKQIFKQLEEEYQSEYEMLASKSVAYKQYMELHSEEDYLNNECLKREAKIAAQKEAEKQRKDLVMKKFQNNVINMKLLQWEKKLMAEFDPRKGFIEQLVKPMGMNFSLPKSDDQQHSELPPTRLLQAQKKPKKDRSKENKPVNIATEIGNRPIGHKRQLESVFKCSQSLPKFRSDEVSTPVKLDVPTKGQQRSIAAKTTLAQKAAPLRVDMDERCRVQFQPENVTKRTLTVNKPNIQLGRSRDGKLPLKKEMLTHPDNQHDSIANRDEVKLSVPEGKPGNFNSERHSSSAFLSNFGPSKNTLNESNQPNPNIADNEPANASFQFGYVQNDDSNKSDDISYPNVWEENDSFNESFGSFAPSFLAFPQNSPQNKAPQKINYKLKTTFNFGNTSNKGCTPFRP